MAIHFNHVVQTSELTYLHETELSTLSKKIKGETFSGGEEEERGRNNNAVVFGWPSTRIEKTRKLGKRGSSSLGSCPELYF
jgi:hypothetical protein